MRMREQESPVPCPYSACSVTLQYVDQKLELGTRTTAQPRARAQGFVIPPQNRGNAVSHATYSRVALSRGTGRAALERFRAAAC